MSKVIYDINHVSAIKLKKEGYKVLLFIDWDVPAFDKNAGYFITFEYLKIFLALGYKIIFWPYNIANFKLYAEKLQQLGIEVVYRNQFFEKYIKKNGKHLDLVVISRPRIAEEYFPLVRKYSMAKIFYLAQDLHFLREMRLSKINSDEKIKTQAEKTKKIEISIMRQSDNSLFFSNKELEIVRELDKKIKANVIPWIQPVLTNRERVRLNNRDGLLFIGGFAHLPNIDAILWFHKEIFPIIKKSFPQITVTILGSDAPQEILDLNSLDFSVLGFVEEKDLPKYFNSAKIFIAPLRYGAGFKGKIARAMAFGLPVITTGIGAEGIDLVDGENAILANNPEEFARKVIELYRNSGLWNKISENSINHVIKNYSVENAKEKLSQIIFSHNG